MDPTIIHDVLSTQPLFSGMPDEEKNQLIKQGRVRRFEKGQNVFLYGDKILGFFIVAEGAVQLYRETPDGHEMTHDVMIAGDILSETEILQLSNTHQCNALAIKDSILVEYPVSWLKENVQKSGALALNILGILSRRTHIAAIEAEHKATMTAAQQVSCFLERLCILHDFDPNGFELPYSKTLIASRLGMELETFSRALSKLREHGVSIQGNKVTFKDIDSIEDFVCSNCSIAGNCGEHEELRERLRRNKLATRAQAT